ncbi:translation initiation factor IF-2, mitochondrial [Planococcus citri]|uniref:translation initiation factor IF-2, mitochondrial n=1 Tax=Planococcus citri TaxID=170843 RepID=UPI0031F996FC
MYFIRRIKKTTLLSIFEVTYSRCFAEKFGYQIGREWRRVYPVQSAASFHTSCCPFSKKKREERLKAQELDYTSPKKRKKVIEVWPNMTVEELSRSMGKPIDDVFELMTFVDNTFGLDRPTDVIENFDTLCDIIKKANLRWKMRENTQENTAIEDKDAYRQPPAPPEQLQKRPPVVTIMGHVDHGKTTLLDYLRKSSIVSGEFGGITQHIGAFSVKVGKESITFLDTPGHAAFTAMRSRGAHCTDIVVLVVAADDGVMEQTIESIRMAKEANVPIVVAINKMDKPTADLERTKKMLMMRGLTLEEFGGDVQAIPISALRGTNVSQLTEAILVLADLTDLKATYSGSVEGVILESKMDRYKGKLSTALIQRGTLRKGCILTAGLAWCKVKKLLNDKSLEILEAPPSTPVEIVGWNDLPAPGDVMLQVESEHRANEVLRYRQKIQMTEKAKKDLPSIESARAESKNYYKERLIEKRRRRHAKINWDEFRQKQKEMHNKNKPELNIIVKADVEGSLEAISDLLVSYNSSICDLNIVHSGIGSISLTDVEMAEPFNAIVYSFNVGVLPDAQELANRSGIAIKHQNVIYHFLEDVKTEINSRLPPKEMEEVTGEAVVQELFLINEGKKKKIPVAGCRCIKGELKKSSLYKVMRNDQEIFRGSLSSMRNLKTEVTSIKKDQHCGLKFEDTSVVFQPGDVIQAFRTYTVPQEIEWNPF